MKRSAFAAAAAEFSRQSASGQKSNSAELTLCHEQAFYNHSIAKLLSARGCFADAIDCDHLQSMLGFGQCIRYPHPCWVPHRSVPVIFGRF